MSYNTSWANPNPSSPGEKITSNRTRFGEMVAESRGAPDLNPWLVAVIFVFVAAVFVPLIIALIHVSHQRAHDARICKERGGVYIDARDYHKCLYGVTTTPPGGNHG